MRAPALHAMRLSPILAAAAGPGGPLRCIDVSAVVPCPSRELKGQGSNLLRDPTVVRTKRRHTGCASTAVATPGPRAARHG